MRRPKKRKPPSRAYRIWASMIQRCTNPKRPHFDRYGGRGIKVCERWRDFKHFQADMGDPPAGYQIDRINNDGDYEPSNCRWVVPAEQARNTRRNVRITIGDRTQLLSDWCAETGTNIGTARARKAGGWTWERALFTPTGVRPRKDSVAQTRGVRQRGARWEARITKAGQQIYLGSFATKEEAAAAYLKEKNNA